MEKLYACSIHQVITVCPFSLPTSMPIAKQLASIKGKGTSLPLDAPAFIHVSSACLSLKITAQTTSGTCWELWAGKLRSLGCGLGGDEPSQIFQPKS